jgi:hypothetical protein
MNNYLILRSQNSPYNDVTKSSVLSFADMDDNLIFLKGNIIYTATTNGGIVTLKKYNGEDITFAGGGSGSGDSYWTSGSTGNYSIKTINDSTTDATGNYAVAEGYQTLASGNYSHAEGYRTTASGEVSHAQGDNTIASGGVSHAEGGNTIAIGDYSHVEGYNSVAIGYSSHVEGINTIAGWKGFMVSSVSGRTITLNSSYGDITSEFLGNKILTNSYVSKNTYGIDSVSFVLGSTEIVVSDDYVYPNFLYVADYNNLYSENANVINYGRYTHAEGRYTKAIGEASHAEGRNTEAIGNYSHAEGNYTISSNIYSHAEGDGTITYGLASHAEGGYTTTGWKGFSIESVVNGLVKLYSYYGDVTLDFESNTALFNNVGQMNRDEIKSYSDVTFDGTNTYIQLNDTSLNNGDSIADITRPYAGSVYQGLYTHAEGERTKAIGDASHAEGYNTKAIGANSHAEGMNTTAIAINSHAGGYNTVASGDTSFIHSSNSLVTGNRSAVLGGIGITGTSNDTVYVPYLNIQSATTDNAITEVLVIDTSGNVKKRDVSTISGGGTFTGGTYNNSTGITTFTNNTGGTFNVTGYFKTSDDVYTTGMTFNTGNYNLTINRNDNTSFTQNLSILATDMIVTGGTYNPNSGVATFTNNSGGTFNVSGFLTGMTDTYVTGLTFNNNILTLKQTDYQADLFVLFNTVTGLTSTGTISSSILSATTYQNLPVDVFTTGFTYNNANTLTIVNNTGGTLTTSLNILTGLTVSGVVSATTISGNTIYANDFPQLPYTDGQTIDHYEVGSTTYIRIKDSVAAPSGGTRSFIGNVNITSGLTVNGNITYTGQTNNPVYTAGTVTATHIPNWDNSNIQDVILSAATTNISGGTNIANGAVYTMILKQNASGSRTVNWDSQYKWQSGIAPVLSSTANAVDIITLISDGTNLYGLIAKDFR